MPHGSGDYQRFCPGEEKIRISDAICLGRRRANFARCPGCQFNDDERGRPSFAAQVVKAGQDARPPALAITPGRLGQSPHSSRSVRLGNLEGSVIEKVFKAYDVRATYPEPLNEDVAWRIGNATVQYLRSIQTGYDRSDPDLATILVGRDMRKSSPSLAAALIEGALATGSRVIDLGLIDTSQLYFAVNHLKCCGGVQTTASHNPANYNGFKICGPKGKPIGADSGLKEIQRIAQAIARYKSSHAERPRQMDLLAEYGRFLREKLRPPRPRPLKVVVDASNGMAGWCFPAIFDSVPNLSYAPLYFDIDRDFVHPPNPLVAANLEALRAKVRETGADFGACFDGDADRCIFVDERASIIRCDLLTALLADEHLRDNPGATVVYDLRSSRIVPETIRRLGGVPKRERVGHVFMKRAMADSHGVVGGELSGHFYFRDYFYCDSGFLTFINVLNIMTRTGKPLGELIRPLEVYASSGERNFENDDKDATLRRIRDRYADAQIDTLDGVTVQYPDWWFNIRASNTEPLLRLNLEANDAALLAARLAELTPLLGRQVDH